MSSEKAMSAPVDAVVMPPRREDVHPLLLTSLIGDGNYLMPIAMLPKMDCERCLYRAEQWRDDGHCYMFRDKPDGTHCGQFRTA